MEKHMKATKSPKVYIFHSDPGHGWLAVKMKELISFGLETKISSYSYQKGKTVYLEEDCDASLFVKTLKEKNIPFELRESYQDKTPIRYYDSYKVPVENLQVLEDA
jgi:hypothetical protein